MQRSFLIHTMSPLHAGVGQAEGAIDLPIARLQGTGIPFLPGSSIKGVLRDAHEASAKGDNEARLVRSAFGPPVDLSQEAATFAGALAFGDARLLAMPIRSFYGTFAWATSPLLLRLAQRDLGWTECSVPSLPDPKRVGTAVCAAESALLSRQSDSTIFLEELTCQVSQDEALRKAANAWATKLGRLVLGDDHLTHFKERFVILDDETMSFLCECGTQVDARVRINDRGVVQDGALWYEESLPAETLLLALATVVGRHKEPKQLLDLCLGEARCDLQFGGKASVGRGRVRIIPVTGAGR